MVTKLKTPLTQAAPTVEIFSAFSDAIADWGKLFAIAPVSAYQNPDYALAWFETLGRRTGLTPMIVVARDASGTPLALYPLAVRRSGGIRIAEFLCGRESNFNVPLVRVGANLDPKAVLIEAARRNGAADLIYLRNQPLDFAGVENKLAHLESRPSASFAFGTVLPKDKATLDARLSKDTRKKLRKKEQKLATLGVLSFEHDPTPQRAREIVVALLQQKATRFAQKGISSPFATKEMGDFLMRLLEAQILRVHALSVGGRIVATYVGFTHDKRFSALANSFDMDDSIACCSPGDILLNALVRDCVERGYAYFDLGVGEARYKNAICDDTIELRDAILIATPRGAFAALLFRAFLYAKREVKQSPWLRGAFEAVLKLKAASLGRG